MIEICPPGLVVVEIQQMGVWKKTCDFASRQNTHISLTYFLIEELILLLGQLSAQWSLLVWRDLIANCGSTMLYGVVHWRLWSWL